MNHTFSGVDEFVITDAPAVSQPAVCDAPNAQKKRDSVGWFLKYLFAGCVFGIVFIKAEIFSWFRIQEMFRLHSFHMYGVIGTAVGVGMLSVYGIKKLKIRTIQGEAVQFHPKVFQKGQVIGGFLFGLGWALTGACPGPLFVQIGAGVVSVGVTLLSALAGTWVYGWLRDKLPS